MLTTKATISLILVVVGIVVSIVVSQKKNINGGIIALVFAWFIGCGINGISASTLVGYWPTTVMFILISTSLFFGVARENGTLTLLAQKILWKFRKAPALIPLGVFLTGFIIGAAGAGSLAPQLFLATLIFGMASELGINPLILMCASWGGSVAGGGMFWSGEGANRIAYYGDVLGADHPAVYPTVAIYSLYLFLALLIINIIWYFILGGYKAKGNLTLTEPGKFNATQKKNLVIVGIAIALILVFSIAKLAAPTAFTKRAAALFDVQTVCIVGFFVCVILGLCEEKKIINMVPINLILTIAGFCMLIKVAVSFGLTDLFKTILQNTSMPAFIFPALFLLFSACISLFANFAVIYPLMMPLIPIVAAATGVNTIALFVGMGLGSCATGFSPFSTGGACQLSGCPSAELSQKIVPRQLGMAICNAILLAALGALGLFSLFPDPLAAYLPL